MIVMFPYDAYCWSVTMESVSHEIYNLFKPMNLKTVSSLAAVDLIHLEAD